VRRWSVGALAVGTTAAMMIVVGVVGMPPASAAIVPTVNLGTATTYAVLGAQTVINTGPSVVSGNLGLYPGLPPAVVGFGQPFPLNGQVTNGTINAGNGAAQQAQADNVTAYGDATLRSLTSPPVPNNLGGLTLGPGVYGALPAAGPMGITGTLVLDGQNNPDAVFIFKTDSTLITASSSTVMLTRGAQACNVFWRVGSSATLGTDSKFVGTILASTAVTVTTRAEVEGRVFAQTAAVNLDTNKITRPTSCISRTRTPPTISKAFGAGTIPFNGTTSLRFTVTNPNSDTSLTNVHFTDTLPAGLVVAAPSSLSSSCGGTTTATSGSGSIELSGGTLSANESCTISLNVTGTTSGTKNNTTSTVTSTERGPGSPASASITVGPGPGAGARGRGGRGRAGGGEEEVIPKGGAETGAGGAAQSGDSVLTAVGVVAPVAPDAAMSQATRRRRGLPAGHGPGHSGLRGDK
jgi:uncharacterized repeat protein (TIGR01451 family)